MTQADLQEGGFVDLFLGYHCDATVGCGAQRRRSMAPLEKRSFSKEGSGSHLRNGLSVYLDGEHPVQDQEQRLTWAPLLDQSFPGADLTAAQRGSLPHD